jgi:F1F0 ATPase subunit 2
MHMGAIQTYIVPFIIGSLMGLLYFMGLWQTVQRLASSEKPYRLLLFSYASRLTIALGGFYLFMDGPWERLAGVCLGFFIVRTLLVRTLGKVPESEPKGAAAWKS